MFEQLKGKKCIIRGYASGVQYGTVEEVVPNPGTYVSVHLTNSRRLWYWDGAFTLSSVAEKGINDKSRLSMITANQYVCDCCEILECSEDAIQCLDSMPSHH